MEKIFDSMVLEYSKSDAIYKQEITNLKKKFAQNSYPKKFVDEIVERWITEMNIER